MPEQTIHLLSTATLADDAVSRASKHGITISVIPFFRTEEVVDHETKQTILSLASQPSIVVFTSKQAVQAVVSHLSKVPPWKIFCLNQATKREVLAYWNKEAIIGEAATGEALAHKIIAARPIKEVVFFCGKQRMDTLPRMLTTPRILLKEVVVYQTVPTPSVVTDSYDAICFFNPIGVHSFFLRNKPGNAVLFSIGETTSNAIRSYVGGETPVITITTPCKEEMVDKVIAYFNTTKKQRNGK